MGTRASFWIGDPRDIENREWLGCIAYDGHPCNMTRDGLHLIDSEEDYRQWVKDNLEDRTTFARPGEGWPYPWADDIFLTDFTYAFLDGKSQFWPDYGPPRLLSSDIEVSAAWDAFYNDEGPEPEDDYIGSNHPKRDPGTINCPAPEPYTRTTKDGFLRIRSLK